MNFKQINTKDTYMLVMAWIELPFENYLQLHENLADSEAIHLCNEIIFKKNRN